MYRIVLIDDEPQIRKGLANLIFWDELGIELAGEAADGESAWTLIREARPQLAIVDIQMPHMDGITLLKKASELKNPPKFIMLSGFDQFEYVRASMRLGACNYLLKPVNAEELKTTLQETVGLLDDEAAKKQQFEESMSALRNNTLNRLLTSRIEVRELREKCQLLGITLRCNHMSVGALRPVFDNTDATLRHILFDGMAICSEVFTEPLTAYFLADAFDNIVAIIKNPDGLGDDVLADLLDTCAKRMTEKLNVKCDFALGDSANSFRELPASYQCARRLLDIKDLWNEADLTPTKMAAMQQIVASSFDAGELQSLLYDGKLAELTQIVRDFFGRTLPQNHVSDPTTIKYHAVELVTCILQAAQKCYISDPELSRLKAASYAGIRGAGSVEALQTEIETLLRHVSEQAQCIDTHGYSQNVSLAVRYIHQHYDDGNLSLKTLSNRLKINSAYLGRQFSLETGAFFSDYLNNIRIRHAKELLNTTSRKVSEIAESVGFTNVSYFNTIYKKITGERPCNTRNQDRG